ncbi:T-cell-interacting, activating receptor on myeloid cells protein 1-like [Notamacropus eugenii]|uniref:T-cell-interacting, activating receptor on myeloid cells protein 1-like n=1 Tax=Notamacropus eugenii TaxID=9315 RepID=UPI003B6701E9
MELVDCPGFAELTSCHATCNATCNEAPSLTLAVSGPGNQGTKASLIKPLILAKPSSVVAPGTSVTLQCWIIQSAHQELTFTLLKAGVPRYYSQKQAEREANFSLPSVRTENAGGYNCVYSEKREPKRWSRASDRLDLVVTGSFPKPSFLAHPGPKVALGGSVILRCMLPLPRPSPENMNFILLKAGNPEPVQPPKCARRLAEFSLQSLTAQDAGEYRCIYYEKNGLLRDSEPSEPLTICVTDSLTKPSLTVQPSSSISRKECDIPLSGVSLWHQIHSVQGGRGDACWHNQFHPGQG